MSGSLLAGPNTDTSQEPETRTTRTRRGLFALPEARWATLSLAAFLLGLTVELFTTQHWLSWALYLTCYLAGGWEPAWSGLCALRRRTLDVDLLMIVAAVGAASIGQLTDGGLLIVIFATSGALEAFATARTEDSVRGLLELAPERATRLREDDAEEVVDTGRLVVGDVIRVRPGERVGADGEILDGSSEVDEAGITGEPLPTVKAPGHEVFAGTLNGAGSLLVRVHRDASDSVIARIVAMVSEAGRTKAPTQLFIDRIEQRYSVGVVIATLAVFTIPLLLGEPFEAALLRAMTFMIVASPCAVVLATMPPLLSAIANAGRHGVLVKSAVAMEQLAATTRVALDKTGTLTEGAPRVVEAHPAPEAGYSSDRVLSLAASVEHLSEHPLARAVVAAATDRGLVLPTAENFASTPGRGVGATVDGQHVRVGSPNSFEHESTGSTAPLVRSLEHGGRTAVLVVVDGTGVGVLAVADRLRPDAAEAVRAFRSLTGTEPVLLSGDNERTALVVASEAGIDDVRAPLLPQDKVTAVAAEQASGHRVTMLGDGVNDAPALAAAHNGVAMGGTGADLTLHTADVVVVRDELTSVARVIDLSRRTRRLVAQNLVIAGSFITVLIVWDLVGHLPLPLGVAGHEGSTVLVGLNGLRMLRESAWPTRKK